jgi:hypothetical protein
VRLQRQSHVKYVFIQYGVPWTTSPCFGKFHNGVIHRSGLFHEERNMCLMLTKNITADYFWLTTGVSHHGWLITRKTLFLSGANLN